MLTERRRGTATVFLEEAGCQVCWCITDRIKANLISIKCVLSRAHKRSLTYPLPAPTSMRRYSVQSESKDKSCFTPSIIIVIAGCDESIASPIVDPCMWLSLAVVVPVFTAGRKTLKTTQYSKQVSGSSFFNFFFLVLLASMDEFRGTLYDPARDWNGFQLWQRQKA